MWVLGSQSFQCRSMEEPRRSPTSRKKVRSRRRVLEIMVRSIRSAQSGSSVLDKYINNIHSWWAVVRPVCCRDPLSLRSIARLVRLL